VIEDSVGQFMSILQNDGGDSGGEEDEFQLAEDLENTLSNRSNPWILKNLLEISINRSLLNPY
jgi:hypothetical protein